MRQHFVPTRTCRTLALLLAVSSAFFGHSNGLPVTPRSPSSEPEVEQIVQSSIAATLRSWHGRLRYSYVERDEERRFDAKRSVKSEKVDVSRLILDGVPFEQLVERNGRPVSDLEEQKQRARSEKLKREAPEQHVERLRNEEEESASLAREIPKAFDFKLAGEEIVNGTPAYVLDATPHPGYHPQGKYGRIFSKLKGKLWVDKQDFGWVRATGHVVEPSSVGFLVRLQRGSLITMQQTRIDDGNWVPGRVEVRAAAKIFFIKNLVINRILTDSEWRLAEART